MKRYVVCKSDCEYSWPIAVYKHKKDAKKNKNTLKYPNGNCYGKVYEIELITDNGKGNC